MTPEVEAIRRRVDRLDGHTAYHDAVQCQNDRAFLLELVEGLYLQVKAREAELKTANEELLRLRRSL